MRYFFVNLGKYYKEQRQGNFLWAPIYNRRGTRVFHWEMMQKVNRGDIIFCNCNSHIVSIGVAQSSAYSSSIPAAFHDSWTTQGRRVDMHFFDLEKPFRFYNHKDFILEHINTCQNPFDVSGRAKQGYLFSLDFQIARYFFEQIGEATLVDRIYEDIDLLKNDQVESEEETEQLEKIHNGFVTGYSREELEKKCHEKYQYDSQNTFSSQSYRRQKTDPKLKATRLEFAHFLCEIDPTHQTFLNTLGTHSYMELHHIIPLKAQKYFRHINLDHISNLISVCPICHRKVHYANIETKRKIFLQMYQVRKAEMLQAGFLEEELDTIFDRYYC